MANNQFVVIADDITGAAEIAGIGLRFGLRVSLIIYNEEENILPCNDAELIVYATNTRSMPEEKAVEVTKQLAGLIKGANQKLSFKKIDSVLRGHIAREVNVLMEEFGYKTAMLLPQNPSKHRIIQKKIYFIDTLSINQTRFAIDPEFPAKSANPIVMLRRRGLDVHYIKTKEEFTKEGICLAEASTSLDIDRRIQDLNDRILPAGSADFFTAFLVSKGCTEKERPAFKGLGDKSALIVLGSTMQHPITEFPYIQRINPYICNIPSVIFYQRTPKQWLQKICRRFATHKSMVIKTKTIVKSLEAARNLKKETANAVQYVLAENTPQELIIEGGATAFEILSLLGWSNFNVEQEVSPGVIRIIPAEGTGITVTLKPGSYSWGELFN